MSIRACLFDLDDTLIDRESAYTNVYKDYYYQEEVIRNSLDLNEAIDYFWKIDIPSFSYHLIRFLMTIDIFIDNTNYLEPSISSLDYATFRFNNEWKVLNPKLNIWFNSFKKKDFMKMTLPKKNK